MRLSTSVILVLCVLSYSCNKSGGGTTTPPVNPPAGAITITNISPVAPYADDEITITGTGFNPDKTKDTVDFGGGDPASGVFNPYAQGQGNSSKCVIISATSTQLVIKAVNPDSTATSLDYQLFKRLNLGLNASNRIRVRTGGAKTMSALIPFKQLPDVSIEMVSDNGIWQQGIQYYWMRPNDSVRIQLFGVNSSEACETKVSISCSKLVCSFVDGYLTFNGLSPHCDCNDFGTVVYGCAGNFFQGKLISLTPTQHFAIAHFLVPSNFFNTSIHQGLDPGIRLSMKVTNADGKFKIREAVCMVYPNH
jgi:hypothetical protein